MDIPVETIAAIRAEARDIRYAAQFADRSADMRSELRRAEALEEEARQLERAGQPAPQLTTPAPQPIKQDRQARISEAITKIERLLAAQQEQGCKQ